VTGEPTALEGHRRRGLGAARCEACGLHQPLCVCASLPRLAVRTHLTLVLHFKEARRPSNTGGLALACLEHGRQVVFGARDSEPPDLSWAAGTSPVLLFPAVDAVPLGDFAAAAPGPLMLVVPDGTWGQASRMRVRLPALAALPCVGLPAGEPARFRLRDRERPDQLSTLEAIARALGILEGPHVRAALEDVLALYARRTATMRGKQAGC
jgi:tRNA-uridine aminocarboxypropyltransferase